MPTATMARHSVLLQALLAAERQPPAHLPLRLGAARRLQRAAGLHHLQRQRRQLADVGLERLVVGPAAVGGTRLVQGAGRSGGGGGGSGAQPAMLPART